MTKKRVLFHSEASYLNTGYATYGREVISRLIATGKYEVAEYSSYGTADDPRRKTIPWKNYANAPGRNDSEEVHKQYNSNGVNQFGAWRFERACLDFKPDVVISQRDSWMEAWIKQCPYRDIFSWMWASTVDGAPQNPEWINQFASTDYFYTLSDWATEIVKEQGGDSINHINSVSSCAANEFVPVPNKVAHRISMGVDPDWKIIGTVMRNQRRKLFPDLFEAFGEFIRAKPGRDNFYLYCHTSYPDNGWDLPQLMVKNGISSRVLFTYTCDNCKNLSIDKFSDAIKQCKHCKMFASKLSNVSSGATTEQLAKTYQLFDLYYQCSCSEGIGIPAIEAAACGIPVMTTDYSAMSDVVRKVDGFPVPVKNKYLELETGCYRALPDKEETIKYWDWFFSLTEDERLSIGAKARESYEASYSWDKTVNGWMKSIDVCPTADWSKPIRQISIPDDSLPEFPNNKAFLDWAISTYLPHSNLINSYEANCMLRDLNFQSYKPNPCGYFYAESSYFERTNFVPFTRADVIRLVKHKAEIFNFWEKARVGQVKFEQEAWL